MNPVDVLIVKDLTFYDSILSKFCQCFDKNTIMDYIELFSQPISTLEEQ